MVLVEMADRILTPFDPPLSARARAQLEELGVEVRTGVRVESIDARGVTVGGETLQAGTVLWGAGVRPSPLAAMLGVPLDGAGPRHRRPDCAVPGHPELFVVGDMASFTPEGASAPLPGISPVAIQGARAVAQTSWVTSRACRGALSLLRQGVHGDDRARARRRAARTPAHVGADRVAGVGVRAPLVPGRLRRACGADLAGSALRHQRGRDVRDHEVICYLNTETRGHRVFFKYENSD